MAEECEKVKGCCKVVCEDADKTRQTTMFQMKNPNITKNTEDVLYHLALGNKSHDLAEMFGDVKFICTGGTPDRMEKFAYFILKEIGYKIPPGTMLQDISIHSHRYALFKVGPVISVSHGMGQPSISILLHELIKLMYHAGVRDPVFLRLGTCGGLGVEPGTVVVTTEPLNGMLEPVHVVPILGKLVKRPAILDRKLAEQIIALHEKSDNFEIIGGKTICTDDFYEGQARLDGAICDYNETDKLAFLNMAREKGVRNFEMESLVLASTTHLVGIKCAVICVTLLDRLKGDQVNRSKAILEEWQNRPQIIAARYIKKYLQENKGAAIGGVPGSGKLKKEEKDRCEKILQEKKPPAPITNTTTTITPAGPTGTSEAPNQKVDDESKYDGCVSGCSIIVSNPDYLQHVLDESNSVE